MRLLVLRFLCLVSLSVWAGGFTFYSAVVIPVLHESLGSLETGYVTQRVTDYLNAVGGVAVALWWLLAWADRPAGPAVAGRARLGLLAATTLLLAGVIVLPGSWTGGSNPAACGASTRCTGPTWSPARPNGSSTWG